MSDNKISVPGSRRQLGGTAPVDVDRLVAGAFFFRELTAAQWDEYVSARAVLRRTPDALVDELDFVAALVERDRTLA